MLKKLNAFRGDDQAVSPVIGVILMVAVTVVLAAVIGAFVFGIGDSLNQPQPNADVTFDYNADNEVVEVIHDGGDSITSDNTGELSAPAEGDNLEHDWNADVVDDPGDEDAAVVDGEAISAGDTIVTISANDPDGGDEVVSAELIWESPDGANSNVLGTFEAP